MLEFWIMNTVSIWFWIVLTMFSFGWHTSIYDVTVVWCIESMEHSNYACHP